jgi:16S rRNA pseudouridine516 synthase
MRLDKYLTRCGYGDKKRVKEGIKHQYVTINGKIITDPHYQILDTDQIIISSDFVPYKQLIYLMMNKPEGYICSTQDENYPSIYHLIDEKNKLFPIGRLDVDTTGLIIFTNDYKLAHHLALPNNQIKKRYLVEFYGTITQEDIFSLEHGIKIDDYLTKPSRVIIKDEHHLEIEIQEGKYHEIKKMFLAINLKVISLKRIMINNLFLDDNLPLGAYRTLTQDEIFLLSH